MVFCSRLEAASDVISGRFVRPIVLKKCKISWSVLKPCSRNSTRIRRMQYFRVFFTITSDWKYNNVISGVDVDYVRVKFGYSRSNSFRYIQGADFVSCIPIVRLKTVISLNRTLNPITIQRIQQCRPKDSKHDNSHFCFPTRNNENRPLHRTIAPPFVIGAVGVPPLPPFRNAPTWCRTSLPPQVLILGGWVIRTHPHFCRWTKR